MKMGKHRTFGSWAFSTRVFAAMVAIMVISFVFTGCSDSGEAIPVTSISLAGDTTFSLVVGENEVLIPTVQPESATNKTVIWTSSDTDVAIVSEGTVYAVGAGTATITATTRDGRRTATRTVTVTGKIAVTGVEINKVLFLEAGASRSKTLTLTFNPANATNKNVTWTSYNPVVATVSNGTVTGVGVGTTTITAITADGFFEAACAVTVVTEIPDIDGMVWISPGTFMMGSPNDEPESNGDEIRHQVTLTEGFYMGIYPVTQQQYLDVMEENISYHPQVGNPYIDRWAEFPLERVTWHETILYCNKLSIIKGLSPAYTMYKDSAPNADSTTPEGPKDAWVDVPENWSTDPVDWGVVPIYASSPGATRWDNVRMVPYSNGYRLPTEAQWEYACRAGTTTPFNTYRPGEPNIPATYTDDDPPVLINHGKNYDGYNITTEQANYWGTLPYNNGPPGKWLNYPVPAGLYKSPNAWDLHDMHGNVTEWCWDRYEYGRDVSPAVTNPTGADTGNNRVIRGGSFWDYAKDTRSAARKFALPSSYSTTGGFRVIRYY
jgi:formylglycine-generating enzyme required for sulfatase activity